MRNHSCDNKFRLQVHFHANQTHLHLKQRLNVTWKWPIHPRESNPPGGGGINKQERTRKESFVSRIKFGMFFTEVSSFSIFMTLQFKCPRNYTE